MIDHVLNTFRGQYKQQITLGDNENENSVCKNRHNGYIYWKV